MQIIPRRLTWSGDHKYTWLLILFSAAALWFLSRNHGFVPMWVEGMGECIETELRMFGLDKEPISCSLHIGAFSLPLSMSPHIGPGWYYLYAPTLYLWFNKLTTDPYIYRYTGILLYVVNAWILFYLLRIFYKRSISFYTAACFLTCPLLLLATLTDYELEQAMLFFIFLTAFLFSSYIKRGNTSLLLASSMTLGMSLLTRTETVLWPVIPFLLYLALARPHHVLDRWRQIKNKPLIAVAAFLAFCLGASPVIAYNLVCPDLNIFSFASNTVLRRSFDASSTTLWQRIATRVEHFWNFNLLNTWPFFEISTPHYVMAAFWIASVCVLVVRWNRQRQPSLLLLIVSTVVALSIITTGELRREHLFILEPAVLLLITSALAYVDDLGYSRRAVHVVFIILIAANLIVAGINWQMWHKLPPDSQTLLNQSDPALLASHLSELDPADRIFFTNIGMRQYVQYMTAGKIMGEDIMGGKDVSGFVNSVRLALLDSSKKRVFVAVSNEHDGLGGSMPRTKTLYATLDDYNISYQVTHLSNDRNNALYDLVTVEAGVSLASEITMAETLVVTDVVDVQVIAPTPGNRQVIGSVIGAGFKRTDAIRINSDSIVPTFFGNDKWITFSIPLEALANRTTFSLEVIRPQSFERSKGFTVTFRP